MSQPDLDLTERAREPTGQGTHEDPQPVVKVRELHKTFLSRKGQAVEAIRDVSFTVGVGEVVAIIGPSGCGKSSLLRVLAGLDTVYAGEVVLDIGENEASGTQARLPAATVFQTESTLPWLTVEKNITAVGLAKLRLSPRDRAERAREVLELVGLQEFTHAYPHELSGGMRQRVSIARALATRPHLLLMDEPLAALDAQTRLVMQQELLYIWARTRSSVVYITHDIEEAVTLADRIVVMSARPGEVQMVRRTPRRADANVAEMRRDEAFGDLVVELWEAVASSVGTTLSTEGSPAREVTR